MGYETTLVIGMPTSLNYNGKQFFQVYATVDLCKIYGTALDSAPKIERESTIYWFPPTGDGDTEITEDRYGDIPKEITIDNAIKALEKDMNEDSPLHDYRRIKWAHALLKSIQETMREYEVTVLMYGH